MATTTKSSKTKAKDALVVDAAKAVAAAPPQGGADEARAEETVAIAEALTPAGGSVADVLPSSERLAVEILTLRVQAIPEAGFRRAGRHWPAQEVEVPATQFTEAQIHALLTEPMLRVTAGFKKA